MMYSRSQFFGIPYDDNILPGAMGLGDKGWPTHSEFTLLVTQSRVALAYGNDLAFTPEVLLLPFLGKAASIGWQLGEVELGHVPDPQTVYSFCWDQYYPFQQYVGPNAGYAKQMMAVLDGTTKRFGLQVAKYNPGFWQDYYENLANVVSLVNGNGTVLAGGTYALGTSNRYRFEVEVRETAPKVTVRIYKYTNLNATTSTLVHTMTGNPTSTAAREWRLGNFDGDPAIQTDQYNVFFPMGWPGTMATRIRNVATFSTSNLDGLSPYTMGKPRGVEWSVWDEATQSEIPLLGAPKYHKDGAEIDIRSMWDNPVRFRGRIETKNNSAIFNPDGTAYGEDPKQKYQIYVPNDRPMPPGGWPLVGFVQVGYYSVGSWSDMYSEGYIIMRLLLSMGVAVAAIGVRVGELVQSWLFGDFRPAQFPTAIIDAKAAVRHIIDHASTNGVNVAKIYLGGHSSGGSIGGCVMFTRDMTDNSHGTNLTMASNGWPGKADPPVAGAILLDAPINFRKTWDEDPCVPKASLPWQIYGVPGGNARAAISMYNGGAPTDQTIDTTQIEIWDWIQVATHLRPVLFIGSNGDTVVPAHNGTHLRDAYLARGRTDCTYFDMGGVKHDFMTNMPPAELIKSWLQEQGAI